jgi:DeoR/GlpR family transcriptional regulator of sugar metabolism
MLNAERRDKILEALGRDKRVLASEMATHFGVSEDTIRRDLRELAEEGLLRRVYGGAVPRSPASPTYARRKNESPTAKAAIARAAVPLFREGQVVLFDAGTTTLEVAAQLPPDLKLTVVTNSLPVASVLADHPATRVVVLGGVLLKETLATVGAETVEGYRRIRADVCVLGVASLHPDVGLGVFYHEDAEVKRAMVAAAAEVMVVAASDKLGTSAPFLVGPLSVVNTLVTDPAIPDDAVRAYTEAGIRVTRATK